MDNSKQGKTFYVRDVLSIAWKRKLLLIIPIVLVTAITVVSTFYLSPIFEASVTIFMEKPVRLSQDLQRLIGGGPAGMGANSETRESELQSLQNEIVSAPYIAQLVQDIGLDKDPAIELTARKLQVNQPNVTVEDIKFDILLESLRKRIRVEFAGTNQVQILAQSSSAEQAKLIVQNLGDIFIREKTKQESRTISASSDFSADQLQTYEKDVQDKITERTALETELLRVQLDDVVASQANRQQINMEVQAIGLEIAEKEKLIRDAQMGLSSMSGGLPVFEETPALNEKQAEISKLLVTMPELLRKNSWNTPTVVSFKIRLYGLVSDVDEYIAQSIRTKFAEQPEMTKNDLMTLFSLRLRLETIYAYSNNLKLALADLDRRGSLMPGYRARIEQLTREIDASRALRDQFKLRRKARKSLRPC